MEEVKYAYWLCNLPGIGDRTIHRMLRVGKSAERIYRECARRETSVQERLLNKYQGILTQKQVDAMLESARNVDPEEEYGKLQAMGIRFLHFENREYPEKLRVIPDPPYGIYVKGRLPDESRLSVAIIGARECSEYGKYVGRELGRVLGENGVQVISGMARGIDGISQQAAVDSGGMSFGVLGCGVDICYPSENRGLYEQLIRQGGVISTFPIGTEPRAALFPPRNRIVSGLADVVIVVEARQKSGTLITVDMALEQGRDVYVVPGRLTDRLSDGCNRLLKQGAGILLSPEDFLEEMRTLYPSKCLGAGGGRMSGDNMDPEGAAEADQTPKESLERKIYNCLELTPRSVEQIREAVGEGVAYLQVQQILMRLCLSGHIKQASPGFYCKEKP